MHVLAQVHLGLLDEVLESEILLLAGARTFGAVHAAPLALVKPPETVTDETRDRERWEDSLHINGVLALGFILGFPMIFSDLNVAEIYRQLVHCLGP